MSWDQPAYSFGSPNAQNPPTPTRTPTSAQFPSQPFQTPKNNSSSFEDRSGWTPQFAEEYSVFFQTPGRLTSAAFADIETPRERQPLSCDGDIAIESSTRTHDLSPNPNTPLPAADPELPSSPGLYATSQRRPNAPAKKDTKVTPRKPSRSLEEAFGTQTATPPASSKGHRKLAPKIETNKMQDDSQGGQNYGSSQTPTAFSATSAEFFFPMSAPATAPVFTNTKNFWDPDAMDMDYPTTSEDGMFNVGSHKISNSLDWGRDNQIFQDTVNMQQPGQPTPKLTSPPIATSTGKRTRPLAPKVTVPEPQQATSLPPFDLSTSAASAEDPFSAVSLDGAVNPGLLFSRHTSFSMPPVFEDSTLPPSHPVNSDIPLEPYSHQLREASRDCEELLRSRGSREGSKARRFDRGSLSSPVKGSAHRPGLQRSVSDSRSRRTQDRSKPRIGRSSPTKHQRPPSLSSIPELPAPRPRTEVKFTIDAKGRARTETVVIDEEEPQTTRRAPSSQSDDLQSSTEESSSDDEPILIPSRNTSFTLPQPPKGPILARFETSKRALDRRRHSSSAYSHSESSSQRSLQQDGGASEAETEVGDGEESGDATQELKKVMEDRKKAQMLKSRNPQHHRYSSTTSRGGGSQYSFGSSTISPTTITDPNGATPSSTRSGTTRCVCNNPDSEGFMIQCESCDNWLHADCVGIDSRSLPPVYVCAFCANTPNMRGGRIRETTRGTAPIGSSPLAHKSFKSFR